MAVTIELPELGLISEAEIPQARRLELHARQTRGDSSPAPPIRTSLLLGGPDAARMQVRAAEDATIADRRGDSEFWSVLMTLSFEPADSETVEGAWLRVDLASAGAGEAPIAFAMDPDRVEEGIDVQRSGGGQASLSVLQISGSEQRSYTIHQAEVLARRKRRSDPGWELRPVKGRPIDGEVDLTLVVRAPKGTSGRGVVSFGATIARKEGALRRTREASLPGEQVAFELV